MVGRTIDLVRSAAIPRRSRHPIIADPVWAGACALSLGLVCTLSIGLVCALSLGLVRALSLGLVCALSIGLVAHCGSSGLEWRRECKVMLDGMKTRDDGFRYLKRSLYTLVADKSGMTKRVGLCEGDETSQLCFSLLDFGGVAQVSGDSRRLSVNDRNQHTGPPTQPREVFDTQAPQKSKFN